MSDPHKGGNEESSGEDTPPPSRDDTTSKTRLIHRLGERNAPLQFQTPSPYALSSTTTTGVPSSSRAGREIMPGVFTSLGAQPAPNSEELLVDQADRVRLDLRTILQSLHGALWTQHSPSCTICEAYGEHMKASRADFHWRGDTRELNHRRMLEVSLRAAFPGWFDHAMSYQRDLQNDVQRLTRQLQNVTLAEAERLAAGPSRPSEEAEILQRRLNDVEADHDHLRRDYHDLLDRYNRAVGEAQDLAIRNRRLERECDDLIAEQTRRVIVGRKRYRSPSRSRSRSRDASPRHHARSPSPRRYETPPRGPSPYVTPPRGSPPPEDPYTGGDIIMQESAPASTDPPPKKGGKGKGKAKAQPANAPSLLVRITDPITGTERDLPAPLMSDIAHLETCRFSDPSFRAIQASAVHKSKMERGSRGSQWTAQECAVMKRVKDMWSKDKSKGKDVNPSSNKGKGREAPSGATTTEAQPSPPKKRKIDSSSKKQAVTFPKVPSLTTDEETVVTEWRRNNIIPNPVREYPDGTLYRADIEVVRWLREWLPADRALARINRLRFADIFSEFEWRDLHLPPNPPGMGNALGPIADGTATRPPTMTTLPAELAAATSSDDDETLRRVQLSEWFVAQGITRAMFPALHGYASRLMGAQPHNRLAALQMARSLANPNLVLLAEERIRRGHPSTMEAEYLHEVDPRYIPGCVLNEDRSRWEIAVSDSNSGDFAPRPMSIAPNGWALDATGERWIANVSIMWDPIANRAVPLEGDGPLAGPSGSRSTAQEEQHPPSPSQMDEDGPSTSGPRLGDEELLEEPGNPEDWGMS
ncbi:hypothetical protein SISNIDRAFT_551147 [Sistotremastrum niveocremeum HHB9708]|uniref:Uncharacterized protein n=2 Tax=Sistotremastrum niveocremeum HHB9708 TaxID=1314777 RepID=A0A164RZF2_9AGAM|nr:hypothetical protein SISNIDRAFT_551147 [Sistotremastrum niveocremeum HHB9708]